MADEIEYKIEKNVIEKWKEKLQAINRPKVYYAEEKEEMMQEVIENSISISESILNEIEERFGLPF